MAAPDDIRDRKARRRAIARYTARARWLFELEDCHRADGEYEAAAECHRAAVMAGHAARAEQVDRAPR